MKVKIHIVLNDLGTSGFWVSDVNSDNEFNKIALKVDHNGATPSVWN